MLVQIRVVQKRIETILSDAIMQAVGIVIVSEKFYNSTKSSSSSYTKTPTNHIQHINYHISDIL
jgi:hypothetical protein